MASTRHFTDPLGSRLPALERNLLRLRAFEMILVLFYAEELRRSVLDTIQATDRFRATQRVPSGTKNPLEKALQALVADRALSADDKKEIIELIDYRNAIGHRVHNLLADLGAEKSMRRNLRYMDDDPKYPKYRYDVLPRLRHFRSKISGLYRTHHYTRTLSFDSLLFSLAEKALGEEINRSDKRVRSLFEQRKTDIRSLNNELSLENTGLDGRWHPAGPYSKYEDGRLTRIGVEICYRLFDFGKSPLAVAHLTELSLAAARKRHKQWLSLGGTKRVRNDLETLPKRKFYRTDD